jgi:hypothetical protein
MRASLSNSPKCESARTLTPALFALVLPRSQVLHELSHDETNSRQ